METILSKKYWIQCLDKKHTKNQKGGKGEDARPTNPLAYSNKTIVTKEGDIT